MANETIVMMARQHDDRWAAFSARPGVRELSSLLRPDQLKKVELLSEFDDEFLRDISPDVSIAKWDASSVVFEAGSYLDVAFFEDLQVEQLGLQHMAAALRRHRLLQRLGSGSGLALGHARDGRGRWHRPSPRP